MYRIKNKLVESHRRGHDGVSHFLQSRIDLSEAQPSAFHGSARFRAPISPQKA